jgi:hypothetical protein
LKEELKQKLENEANIKENVKAAQEELDKLKQSAKKAPKLDQDLQLDQDKIYIDLKEVTLDNLDKNQSLATSKKEVKELEVKIMLIENELDELRAQYEELEGLFNQPMKDYPKLELDESELERLRKELARKKKEIQTLEEQKRSLETKISDAEREYRNIKIHRSEVYIIREEGAEGDEEQKVVSSHQVSSSRQEFVSSSNKYMSPPKEQMSPADIRKSRLSQSPKITRDIENVMKEVYYGRPGPKIRKTDDGTFIYGTREFVVTKERNNLYARDFEEDESKKILLEDYFRKHEVNERETALKTNLQYLNDDIGSEDEEMAEVGEEFDTDNMNRYGFS